MQSAFIGRHVCYTPQHKVVGCNTQHTDTSSSLGNVNTLTDFITASISWQDRQRTNRICWMIINNINGNYKLACWTVWEHAKMLLGWAWVWSLGSAHYCSSVQERERATSALSTANLSGLNQKGMPKSASVCSIKSIGLAPASYELSPNVFTCC